MTPGANVNYGQTIIGPTRAITGRTVRYSNNAIVTSVDIDMIDDCGLEISLTGDLSDAAGIFSLSGVPDGIYQIEIHVKARQYGWRRPLLHPRPPFI